jgi:hypothetical protein
MMSMLVTTSMTRIRRSSGETARAPSSGGNGRANGVMICFARRSRTLHRWGHVFRAHQFVYSTKHIANREGGDFCNLYAFDL